MSFFEKLKANNYLFPIAWTLFGMALCGCGYGVYAVAPKIYQWATASNDTEAVKELINEISLAQDASKVREAETLKLINELKKELAAKPDKSAEVVTVLKQLASRLDENQKELAKGIDRNFDAATADHTKLVALLAEIDKKLVAPQPGPNPEPPGPKPGPKPDPGDLKGDALAAFGYAVEANDPKNSVELGRACEATASGIAAGGLLTLDRARKSLEDGMKEVKTGSQWDAFNDWALEKIKSIRDVKELGVFLAAIGKGLKRAGK